MKYYRLDRILENEASYYMIIGERSNGKSYAALEYALIHYFENGDEFAYIRRWDRDIQGRTGATIFNGHIANGLIEKYSKGKFNTVYYYSGRYYLAKHTKNGDLVKAAEPFGYAFSLNAMEHYKSTSYPNVRTIIFDEFISRSGDLKDEFMLFMNTISTIVRDPSRTDVKVFMLANTVRWDCCYFTEMGIANVSQMKQGTIDIYRYGDSNTIVAIEYCRSDKDIHSVSNDRFFAFNNPRLQMITQGTWEIDTYKHLTREYNKNDIKFTYYIKYQDLFLECDIIRLDNEIFTFIHERRYPLKDEDKEFIFGDQYDMNPRHRRDVTKANDDIGRFIKSFYDNDKILYRTNYIGESVRNYLLWAKEV